MDTKGESFGTLDVAALARLRAATTFVFARSPVLAAYAYGSRVRGRPRPESDLDVGYYVRGYLRGETLSMREESRLASALTDAVGLEIDLRDLAAGSLELRGRVLEDGLRIYSADEPERVALERYVLSRYHDYKDVFRQMHELRVRGAGREGNSASLVPMAGLIFTRVGGLDAPEPLAPGVPSKVLNCSRSGDARGDRRGRGARLEPDALFTTP